MSEVGEKHPEQDLRTQNIIQWLSHSMAVDLAVLCVWAHIFDILDPQLLALLTTLSFPVFRYGTRLRTRRPKRKQPPESPNVSACAGGPVQAWWVRQNVPQCTVCRPRDHAGVGPLGYVGPCDAAPNTHERE